jgi:hypothetical protein
VGRVSDHDMPDERLAQAGELCTCGRQAVVVFRSDVFGETG